MTQRVKEITLSCGQMTLGGPIRNPGLNAKKADPRLYYSQVFGIKLPKIRPPNATQATLTNCLVPNTRAHHPKLRDYPQSALLLVSHVSQKASRRIRKAGSPHPLLFNLVLFIIIILFSPRNPSTHSSHSSCAVTGAHFGWQVGSGKQVNVMPVWRKNDFFSTLLGVENKK